MPSTPTPAITTDWSRVLALRLVRHHLAARTTPDRLVDVVGEMVGLHAQVMSAAELQAAARIDGLRPDDVRDALASQRSLVKAWSFRGTLHLLTPDDLGDFVVAAATRERWHEPVWLRYTEMTEAGVERLIRAVGDILTDEPMTRADLADAVAARLDDPTLAARLRTGWGTFLGAPAQRGELIFGPNDGRNVTFVHPSRWLLRPIALAERRDAGEPIDALGRLVGRFLARFPGSSRDMISRWWGAARGRLVAAALERTPADLASIDVSGTRTWIHAADVDELAAQPPFHGVRLLPGFDPFTNELPRRTESVLPVAHHDDVYRTAGWVTPLVLVDGRIGG
ncbi:MAG TPA: crosslink repair DNA glycosylase YcaQ family protein, partial [Candidatus Limnocylindrales bacterium]|nr:crosslink repair DNA glycosylase YcaQ family protein [Candidatus Limnocylindrales bacterium]